MKFQSIRIAWEPKQSFTPAGYEVRLNYHIMSDHRGWLVVALLETVWHFWRWRLWRREK